MAEMIRNPDYLKRHIDVRDRVRNIETGVHPTGTHLDYYDTFGPTEIDILSGSNWKFYESGILQRRPYWQRRTGLVMLTGAIMLKSGGDLVGDEIIAQLPPEARPLVGPLIIQVSAGTSPYRARISVHVNGDLHILTSGLSESPEVWFDGATWAVN